MNRIIYGLIFLLTSGGMSAQCCSGGVPIAGNLSLPAGASKEGQIQLTYDYNRLRALFFEAENLNDNTRQRSTHSVLLEGSYGFAKNWSVAGLFSFVNQERIIETRPGERQFTSTAGLGDIVLLLRHTLIDNQNWGLSVGLGPKLPIGRNDVPDDNGLLLSADLQPGSGAWDAMFWTAFSKYSILRPTLSFSAMATARLTSTADRIENTQRYKFGNEFQAFFGFSDRIVKGLWFIDPQLMFRFRHVTEDIVNELPLPNTGGTFFHLVPAFVLTPNSNFSFRLAGELPLIRFVQGTQLATSQRITASIFIRLKSSKIDLNPLSGK